MAATWIRSAEVEGTIPLPSIAAEGETGGVCGAESLRINQADARVLVCCAREDARLVHRICAALRSGGLAANIAPGVTGAPQRITMLVAHTSKPCLYVVCQTLRVEAEAIRELRQAFGRAPNHGKHQLMIAPIDAARVYGLVPSIRRALAGMFRYLPPQTETPSTSREQPCASVAAELRRRPTANTSYAYHRRADTRHPTTWRGPRDASKDGW